MPPRPIISEYTTTSNTISSNSNSTTNRNSNNLNVNKMALRYGTNYNSQSSNSTSPTSSQESEPMGSFLSELLQTVSIDEEPSSSQTSSINSPPILNHSTANIMLNNVIGAVGSNSSTLSNSTSSSTNGTSLLHNSLLSGVTTTSASIVQMIQFQCLSCNRNLHVTSKCQECNETLCDPCARTHRRLRTTKDHNLVKLKRDSDSDSLSSSRSSNTPTSLGLCEVHCEQKVLYCENCVCGACGTCALNEHRGHSLIYLQDALANARTICAALMADARMGAQAVKDSLETGQQLAEAVEAGANRATNEVRATIRRFVAAIEERQRELIGRVERARQLRARTLLVQMDGLRLALSRLARTTDLLGEALENAPPIEILQMNERAAAELRKLRTLQLNLMPREDDMIMFTGPEPSLLRSVATLGCVQASAAAVALGSLDQISASLPSLPPAPRGRPILGISEHVVVRIPNPNDVPIIFGGEGDQDGKLCRPWGICCDRNGNILIADRSNNRIQVFRPDGTFLFKFGSHGNLPGQLDRPAGICCDSYGRIVVVDKDNHRIQIFMADGTFVLTFGEKGCKNGQFNYPWDVASNAQSQLVVADTRNHRIQLFGPDGTFLGKYGFEGASPMWKHFDSPRGVCFNPEGHILVTDFNNHRLVVIDPGFMQARFLGSEGSGEKQFLRPQGIICDDDGNFVVADSRNNRIQVFDHSGSLLWKVGSGPGKGPTEIDRPSGLCITQNGRIAVIDFGNHRVVIF